MKKIGLADDGPEGGEDNCSNYEKAQYLIIAEIFEGRDECFFLDDKCQEGDGGKPYK